MKRVLLASFALVLVGLTAVSRLTASQLWLFTGNMPAPRVDHVSFTLPDGRVLVVGENDTGAGPFAPVSSFIYDPATGAWSVGPMPLQPHQNSMSVKLADGRFMVAGGRHNGTAQANAEIYNPFTNTWQVTAPMNRGRVHGTLTLLPDGRVLAAGGFNFAFDPTSETWDPNTNTWTMTSSQMQVGRWLHTATLLDNGDVVVAGGENYVFGGALNSTAIYRNGTWQNGATLAVPRAGHRAAKLPDGRLMLMSGFTGLNVMGTPTTEIYDPSIHTWSLGPTMAIGRFNGPTLVEMPDSTLLMIGGQSSANPVEYTATVERYNPSTNIWSMEPPMNMARTAHIATLLSTGEVLVSGGVASGGMLSSAELFTSPAPVSTAMLSASPNGNGWINTNVDVTLNATVSSGTVQSITYSLSGAQNEFGTVSGSQAIVHIVAEGMTTMTFHATSSSGGIEADQSLTVKIDKTAPLLNIPNEIVTTATSPSGAFVNFVAGGTDPISGVVSTQLAPLFSGQLFPIGTTHETVTIMDAAGNVTVGGFDVTVLPGDTTPPTVTLSASPTNELGWHRFSPSVQISAFDTSGSVQSISYELSGAQNGMFVSPGGFASFNIFNQGITTITYRATDTSGNTSTDQTFIVRYDQQQPQIDSINNITVDATSSSGAVVNYPTPNVTDSLSGVDTITSLPPSGSTFPHGSTTVTVTATDKAGNMSSRNFTVTVNKVLTSIAVLPSTATINEGQSQFFQAQGSFTDGTTAILPTGSSGGGGGGGGGAIWNVHFDSPLNLSQCGSSQHFNSQAIGGPSTLPANIDSLWGPSNSVVRAVGTVTASQVSLTLTCVNGQGAAGSLVATWTGTRYVGTWNFSGLNGNVTVRGWSPKASAPTARFSIGATTVNGIIYVMGGENPGGPSPVEAYDIANDSWSTAGVMPTSREGAAYASFNGKVYAAGGHVAGGFATNTMDVFDPLTGQWTAAAPMTTMRAKFVLVAGGNGRLYAIGGEVGPSGSPATASVEAYDPFTNTWLPQAPMSTPRRAHVAGAVNGAAMIVVAGGNQSGSSTTELYNVFTNMWSSGPSPSSSVDGGSAVVINNALFAVGGTANGGSSRVQMFRPASGPNPAGWAVPGDMPTPRGQLAVAAAGGGSDVLYAIGGARNGVALATVEAMSTPPPSDLSVSSGGGGGGGFTLPIASFSSTNVSVANITSGGQAFGISGGQTTIVATANGISSQTTNTSATLNVISPDHTPPVLTLPTNITAFATSPSGAMVSFTATANDAVDGPRAVSCSPAPGSLFPIGTTTVSCSASDTRGNTASGSFAVTVLSGSQIVTELIADIENFQQANGLLNNVLKSLTNGNTGAACNQLGAFINQVEAQSGKKLTPAEAADLIQVAMAAKAAIGCPQ